MTEWKEVWYVWDGVGELPAQNDIVGVISGFHWRNNGAYSAEHFDLPLIYSKGEKRRRCGGCGGKGKWKENHWFTRRCNTCTGTGWEYKK